MKHNDETTATQILKMLEEGGHKVSLTTIIRARKNLGWTFHGSRYCQLIREKNKEKRVAWAREHLTDNFAGVVWTNEFMIQLENHRTFSYGTPGTDSSLKLKI